MNIYLRALKNFREFLGAKRFYFVMLFGIFVSSISVTEIFLATKVIGFIETFVSTGVSDVSKIIYYSFIWGITVFGVIIFQYIYRYNLVDKDILKFYVNNLNTTARKALHIPYGKYLQKKSGQTFKKLEKGREGFMNFFFFFYLNIIKDFSGIIIITGLMFFINIKMSVIVLSGIPFAVYIGYFFNTKTLFLQNENNRKEDVVFGLIGDILNNFGLFKILSLESYISKHFEKTENNLLEIQNKISKRWAVAHVYINSLVAIMRIIAVVSGCYFVFNGTLTLAELFLFFTLISWIYFPIGGIFGQIRQIQRWGANLEEYYEEFEDDLLQEDLSSGETIKNLEGNIAFQNVSFGYSEKSNILKNINLDIKAGSKIALVGNTGAGKSTLVNLLLRFWDAENGQILLDGQDIREIKKSSLRSHIGVVSQDNSLFNLSIEENLKFASPQASKKQIEEALISAEAQFVFDLPQGLQTVIGERGLKLSGGEKQRISLARLFLKNPEILILDEATSALDNSTEKKIEKALKKLMKGKTSIIIAHRLSTIQYVDMICMLEHGRIVETGNYEELLEKKGKFFALAHPEKLILG